MTDISDRIQTVVGECVMSVADLLSDRKQVYSLTKAVRALTSRGRLTLYASHSPAANPTNSVVSWQFRPASLFPTNKCEFRSAVVSCHRSARLLGTGVR